MRFFQTYWKFRLISCPNSSRGCHISGSRGKNDSMQFGADPQATVVCASGVDFEEFPPNNPASMAVPRVRVWNINDALALADAARIRIPDPRFQWQRSSV